MNVAAVGALHPSHVISPVVIVVIVVVVVVEDKAAYERDAFCGVWVRFRSYVRPRGITNEREAHQDPPVPYTSDFSVTTRNETIHLIDCC